MANVNRTVASPWAFWPDETDSFSQRDTGWIQWYVESPQEALDTVLQAFRVAERAQLPAMVNLDAFYVSHALEPVAVPSQDDVDAYLPPYAPEHRLDPARGESWGNVVDARTWNRHRRALEAAMQRVPSLAAEADREWAARSGRAWGVVERYRCDGASTVVVAAGSLCGTVREAVDALHAAGEPVGLAKLRLFRPLPVDALRAALAGATDVIVLDRDHSPGAGGVLHQEVRAALYGVDSPPRVHGLLAGVGGVNVSPADVAGFVRAARGAAPAVHSQWVG
jgi:pyruvate/2-oxoacid:ferredoxin oxidoreductase alpha subunit